MARMFIIWLLLKSGGEFFQKFYLKGGLDMNYRISRATGNVFQSENR